MASYKVTTLKNLIYLLFIGNHFIVNSQTRHDYSLTLDGKEREYIVVKPSGPTPSGGYPVVFMFHGTSGTGEEFYNISGWKEKGQQEKFITVFPSSLRYCILNFPNNNPAFLTRWFTGDLVTDQCPNLNQDFKDDVKFVRRIVYLVKTKFEINPKKIFAAGFSNGCSFTHKLALEASDLFSACAGVGSILFPGDSVTAVRSIPFWNMIGTEDERFTTQFGLSNLPFNDSLLLYMNGYINRIIKCLNLRNEYTKTSNTNSITYNYSKSLLSNNQGSFQVSFIKNMPHIYPNGINVPFSATSLFWDFFKQSTLTTDIEKIKSTNIEIFPNPVNKELYISSDALISSVLIYRSDGRLIKEIKSINSNTTTVEVSNLNDGIYLFQIQTIYGLITSKTIVKSE